MIFCPIGIGAVFIRVLLINTMLDKYILEPGAVWSFTSRKVNSVAALYEWKNNL